MISETQLRALLSDIESQNVERTISTTDTNKFCEAICAFANDLANSRANGFLIVGARNDGSLSGVEITDRLLQNLSAIRSDGNILPQPVLSVYKMSLPEGEVAIVEVAPSDLPPVRYKGVTWVRPGPRRGRANEQEERLLSERRAVYARTFDARPCRESTITDLSISLFESFRLEAVDPEVIASNNRTIEDQLSSLRFYDPMLNNPTFAGILLFGKNPRFYLPGCYIQYLRIDGTLLTDQSIDSSEISGDLQSVLRELVTRIKANITTTLHRNENLRENNIFSYPEWAVRELLLNAIMHRNYESNTPVRFYWFNDRIEIQNPGGLYGEVTPDNYLRRNSYRNPIIAEALKHLGYVNRYGYGISQAQRLLQENGNESAFFGFETDTVHVTIPARSA